MADRSKNRIPVAILGATGTVGQRFIQLLKQHPWFEIVAITASERSAGKLYSERAQWVQTEPMTERIARMPLGKTHSSALQDARIAFSALDSSVAGEAEEEVARAGLLVVSNAKNHRMDPDVPLLVPEVNSDHIGIAASQNFSNGAILTNPNCSTIGLVLALKPLHDAFGVKRVQVTTLQAVSGAGLPGVSSYQMIDNVVPYIGGEEEKLEEETRKILGVIAGDRIREAEITVSAQCTRVPVIDGHTECVSVELGSKVSEADVRDAWTTFEGEPQKIRLPSAPRPPIHVLEDPAAPQPRLHRDLGDGMAVSIGRLRPCPVLDYKFVVLSHNTVRGAAGGAILVAEAAVQQDVLPGLLGELRR